MGSWLAAEIYHLNANCMLGIGELLTFLYEKTHHVNVVNFYKEN